MDALEKFSFLRLRAEAEIAVLDAYVSKKDEDIERSDDLCSRLAGYILIKHGAKYAGKVNGPRRNHGQP